MKLASTHFRIPGLTLCAAGALLASSAAFSADTAADRRAQYLKDRAACESGQTGQDVATCLREAGAVLNERRGTQNRQAASEAELRANAVQRCNRLPVDQQESCRALTLGQSTQTQGSVPAGGVYREMTIQTPLPAGSQPPASYGSQPPAPYAAPAPAPAHMPAMPPVPAPQGTPVSPMAPITPATPPASPGSVR